MHPDRPATVPLVAFSPGLARAVVAVLARAGVPAWTAEQAHETEVIVPADRREEAFAVLAAHMEQIHAEAADEPGDATEVDDEPGDPPPLVMERFRNMGLLALVLVPLLVITLAAPGMPLGVAIVVYVGAIAVLTAWRERR